MCNVSNQCRSKDEDIINRPWRPVPSGRISAGEAVVLRWTLVFFCVSWSALHHSALTLSTFSLVTTTFLYDELELARHPIGKNLCNIGGYTAFEAGATMMMGRFNVPTEITDSGI
jgi:4-hydroxybenzoate polyprenyltransferase